VFSASMTTTERLLRSCHNAFASSGSIFKLMVSVLSEDSAYLHICLTRVDLLCLLTISPFPARSRLLSAACLGTAYYVLLISSVLVSGSTVNQRQHHRQRTPVLHALQETEVYSMHRCVLLSGG
jgi:hypothetical protein